MPKLSRPHGVRSARLDVARLNLLAWLIASSCGRAPPEELAGRETPSHAQTPPTRESSRPSAPIDSWQPLFSASTPDWAADAGFTLDGGELRATASAESAHAVLPAVYGDFELRFRFKLTDGASGGVDVRADASAGADGYRYALDGTVRAYTGGVRLPDRGTWLMPLDRNFAARAAYRPGEWNDARIVVAGPRLRTFINDVPAAEVFSPTSLAGHIAFHVDAGTGRVAWRDVEVVAHGTTSFESLLADDGPRGWDRGGQAVWQFRGDAFGGEGRRRGDAQAFMTTRRRYRSFALRMRVRAEGIPAQLLVHAERTSSSTIEGIACGLTAVDLGMLVLSRRGEPSAREPGDSNPDSHPKRDGWRTLEIIAVPGRVMSYVDGKRIGELFIDEGRTGRVGFRLIGSMDASAGLRDIELADFDPAFDADPAWRASEGPATALAPATSLAALRVAPGFRAELVVAEPFVVDPIAIDWDRDGNLWVLERPVSDEPRAARLVRLTDENGDGEIDARHEVVDGLARPSGFAFVDGGVLILDAPDLWLCPRAESSHDCRGRRRMGTFGTNGEAVHELPWGPVWTLDNWFYASNWGRRLLYAGGRVRGDDTPARGRGGLATDDAGRLYYGDDERLLAADLLPAEYVARSESLASSRASRNVVGTTLLARDEPLATVRTNAMVNDTRHLAQLGEDGRLRQAVSPGAIAIYRGGLFDAEHVGDVFIAEPAGNVVMHVDIVDDGIELHALHRRYADADWGEREFLSSTDERFRPLALRSGPDGALYIADVYEAVLEAPSDRSDYLRDEVERRRIDETGADGRVYRIVPVGAPGLAGLAAVPTSTEAGRDDLVGALGHANGWVRDRAQQLLVTDDSLKATVVVRGANHRAALGRVHRLWTLRGRRALRESIVAAALGDAHASVRVAALRNADPLLWSGTAPQLRAAVERLRVDPDPRVALQLLATLGEIGTDAQVRETMVHVLTHDCESKAMRTVALSSLGGAEAALLGRLLGDPNWREALPGRAEFLRDLSQRTVSTWVDTARGDDDGRSALHMFAKRIDAMPETGELAWHKAAVLEGIDRATQQPGFRPVPSVSSADDADLLSAQSADPTHAISKLFEVREGSLSGGS